MSRWNFLAIWLVVSVHVCVALDAFDRLGLPLRTPFNFYYTFWSIINFLGTQVALFVPADTALSLPFIGSIYSLYIYITWLRTRARKKLRRNVKSYRWCGGDDFSKSVLHCSRQSFIIALNDAKAIRIGKMGNGMTCQLPWSTNVAFRVACESIARNGCVHAIDRSSGAGPGGYHLHSYN